MGKKQEVELEKACKKFLRERGYARIEWEGSILTAFSKNGEPFEASEYGGKTRRAFMELENLLIGLKLTSYEYPAKA